uniref:Uncharacterized protein n=1 Tax=Strigamia maritima TaxID=126957 RepID=T1JGK8_STRMM
MAVVREARENALHAGVIRGFINCLQSRDIILQMNVCTAIGAYTYDIESRNQLLQHDIMSLIKLLSLSKPEIYLKALGIVSSIGVYNDIAVALCEHGAISSDYALSDASSSTSTSTAYEAIRDPVLIDYLKEVVKTILPMSDIHNRVTALAQFVSSKMGGKFLNENIHTFTPELEISRLKCKYGGNALACRVRIPCSLVRRNLRCVWNEILLPPKQQSCYKIPVQSRNVPPTIG